TSPPAATGKTDGTCVAAVEALRRNPPAVNARHSAIATPHGLPRSRVDDGGFPSLKASTAAATVSFVGVDGSGLHREVTFIATIDCAAAVGVYGGRAVGVESLPAIVRHASCGVHPRSISRSEANIAPRGVHVRGVDCAGARGEHGLSAAVLRRPAREVHGRAAAGMDSTITAVVDGKVGAFDC